MNNKERDIEYCGVDRFKIEHAHPELNMGNLIMFTDTIKERYKIHLLKDVEHAPAPWTDDSIMSVYKFTNVRREHDRQSKYLIEHIVNNNSLTLKEKMANIIMFRAFNNWDTMKDLGGPWSLEQLYDVEGMKKRVRPILKHIYELNPKRCLWSSAYIQSGSKMSWAYASGLRTGKTGEQKEEIAELRPFHIGGWLSRKAVEGLDDRDVLDLCLDAIDQEEVFERIKGLPGFANFLAYQIFVDFTYIEEFPFSENEFTVAGPGCKRGLKQVFKNRDKMTFEECLFWLRDNIEELVPDFKPSKFMTDLPASDRKMNVMSLENCFCEFSKYIRAYNHEGRPRNKYNPYFNKRGE